VIIQVIDENVGKKWGPVSILKCPANSPSMFILFYFFLLFYTGIILDNITSGLHFCRHVVISLWILGWVGVFFFN